MMSINSIAKESSELNSEQEKVKCRHILSSENIGKVHWINQSDLASALSSIKIAKQYISDIKSVRKSVHKIAVELTKSGYSNVPHIINILLSIFLLCKVGQKCYN